MAPDSDNRSSDINIARISPAGIGGIGLVVAALAMAWALPAGRTFVLIALAGAVILSVPLYYWRKNHRGKR